MTDLRQAAKTIAQGVQGIGIERIWSPEQIASAITTINQEDCAAICALIMNVYGQTGNFYNGATLLGAQALAAIAEGYAEILIGLRPHQTQLPPEILSVSLIEQSQKALINWVENGIISVDDNKQYALTHIARDFLDDPILRKIAILPAFSACAVIHTVLSLWQEKSPLP